MTLQIKYIKDTGGPKERVVCQANADETDIGGYVIFAARVDVEDDLRSGPQGPAYWMPDKKLKKDDLVVIYSKNGANREKTNPNGTTSYFLYWNQESPLFGKDSAPVIGKFSSWARARPIGYHEEDEA